jgi:hypothetical protein
MKKYILSLSVYLFVFAFSSHALAQRLIPPGPSGEFKPYLSLPTGVPYFVFAKDLKKAIDKELPDSINFPGATNSRGWPNYNIVLKRGGGVYVKLGKDTYNVHIGYSPTTANGGEDSGRSFAVGPLHGGGADDYTYPQLFNDMEKYFKTHSDTSAFYQGLFEIILNCDPTYMDTNVDPEGRQLISDIVTIFSAEMDRYLMPPDGYKHKWFMHLLEVTMLASFHSSTGLVWNADAAKLEKGEFKLVIGHGEQGSGVGGRAGRARRNFQVKLSNALKNNSETKVVYQNAMKALKATRLEKDIFFAFSKRVIKTKVPNRAAIIKSYIELLSALRGNGMKLTSEVK